MAIGTSMARGTVGRPAAGGGSDARASPDPHRPHDQARPWLGSATAPTLRALRDPPHRSLSPGTDHRSWVLGKGGVDQFACSVGILLSAPLDQGQNGQPGLGAYRYFMQVPEESLAYIVVADNANWAELASAAFNMVSKIYKNISQYAIDASYNGASNCGVLV